MKIKFLCYLLISMTCLVSGSAIAGGTGSAASITLGTDSGARGATVTISMVWDDDSGGFETLGFDVDFATTELTFVSCSLNTPYSTYALASCDETAMGSGKVQIALLESFMTTNIVPSGPIGTLTFQITAMAAYGPTALTVSNPLVGSGRDVTNLNPGSVNVDAPTFASTPAPDAGLSMSGQVSTAVGANFQISNVGVSGTSLNGECDITGNPGIFSLDNDPQPFGAAVGAPIQIAVACVSDNVGMFMGEMTCTHNGDNDSSPTQSPVVVALDCDITPGPQPTFTGVTSPSPLDLVADEQGDADPTGTLTVTNTGQAGSSLDGSCAYTGDAGISMASNSFNLGMGQFTVFNIQCDASSQDSFMGTISCPSNAATTPDEFDVTCEVGPPGPAVLFEDPADMTTINMTAGGAVVIDSTPLPTATIRMRNDAAEADDSPLTLTGCALSNGTTPISQTGGGTGAVLAMGEFVDFTFECDTDNDVDTYQDDFSCNYDEGPAGSSGSTQHSLTCELRDPVTDVDESPQSGTPLLIVVPPNGSNTTSVFLTETVGEGGDDASYSCSLSDDTFFTIIQGTGDTIGSGEQVQVVVQGVDPGPGNSPQFTNLNCTFSDTGGETQVSWPIEVRIAIAEIPTFSTWSRIIMILTLLGFGAVFVRRKVLS